MGAGWGIFLIILVFLIVLTPVLCYIYASTKYGSDKAGIWLRYKCSHSNPELPFLYKPREELDGFATSCPRWTTPKASSCPSRTTPKTWAHAEPRSERPRSDRGACLSHNLACMQCVPTS